MNHNLLHPDLFRASLSQLLTTLTVGTALGAEMEEHLGYGRHERSEIENHRNGHSRKRLIGDHGEVAIDPPGEHLLPSAIHLLFVATVTQALSPN